MLKSFHIPNVLEAGCDEAGRGCLSGPVVAAAVILPADFTHELLNDSKQLTDKMRYQLRPLIEKEAISWAVGIVDNVEIDKINILNASFLAMHRALDQLNTKPEHILVDGNRFTAYPDIEHTCMIKGDARFLSIAAASVLAKTYRDDIMKAYHLEYPEYDWNKNMGYPTKKHRLAIAEFGITPLHRQTYKLLADEQLKLF